MLLKNLSLQANSSKVSMRSYHPILGQKPIDKGNISQHP